MRLEDYREAVVEWLRAKQRCESLRALMDASGQDYSAPKVQTSPQDRMAEVMARLLDREQIEKEKRAKMLDTFSQIEDRIYELEDEDERSILTERYLHFDIKSPARYREWEEIAITLTWSLSKVYKVHKNAVSHYYKD